MVLSTGDEGYKISHLIDNCDWASLDLRSATTVDVGDRHGSISK